VALRFRYDTHGMTPAEVRVTGRWGSGGGAGTSAGGDIGVGVGESTGVGSSNVGASTIG
jgi:hypothetical protein